MAKEIKIKRKDFPFNVCDIVLARSKTLDLWIIGYIEPTFDFEHLKPNDEIIKVSLMCSGNISVSDAEFEKEINVKDYEFTLLKTGK
jgi:hypothetical protein